MTKEDYGNFAWEVMRRWRESDDTIRSKGFEVHKELRQSERDSTD